MEKGYLHNIADIFDLNLRRDDLLEDKIFGLEKNTDKILKQIEEAKSAPAAKVLAGLGIPNVGKATAKELMRSFKSIDELASASEEDLLAVGDIGEISAAGIRDFFSDEENIAILERLKASGLNFEAENNVVGDKLAGMSICITGTLPSMSRDEAVALIESNGGKAVSSVSKKTTYLLAGEAAGSKLTKAQSLGVPVISEDELKSMIE